MFEFFRSWKRKVGCVTLALALVFTVGWIRSMNINDNFHCPISDVTSINLLSMDRHFALGYATIKSKFDRTQRLGWQCYPAAGLETWAEPDFVWIYSVCDFSLLSNGPTSGAYLKTLFIPYWSIVIPLSALSAWLLLSKPRAKITTPMAPASENA